ncbi:hypothetical protein N7486_006131 [Penicillium sp. IBT 16267x]|nr:hypothetical protein N7486_006131 [Penicillium sp. IBT 16267x]
MQNNRSPERFSLGVPGVNFREVYPRSVNELSRTEVKLLTEIVHIHITTASQRQQVQRLIKALPKRLQRQRISLSSLNIKSSGLCDLHRPMNADVLRDILTLVQREVTRCFQPFDRHPQHVRPTETYILSRLRALKGMWTKPVSGNSPVAPGAWPYEINGCPACMLARIAVQKEIVLLLRAALQSRTRTVKNHRPRRLMMFVDECVNRFSYEDAEEMFSISSNLAYRMKATRKACSKGRGNHADRNGLRLRDSRRQNVLATSAAIDGQDGDHDGESVEISEQNVLPARASRLSIDIDIVSATQPVPRSPGTIYPSSTLHHRDMEQLDNTPLHVVRYETTERFDEFCGNVPFSFLGEGNDGEGNLADEESGGSENDCDSSFEDSLF